MSTKPESPADGGSVTDSASRPAAPAGGSAQWLRSNLMGLGSAAVVAVYAAGYQRTRAAAQRFADESSARRPASPVATTGEIGAPSPRPAASAARESEPVVRATAAPATAREEPAARPAAALPAVVHGDPHDRAASNLATPSPASVHDDSTTAHAAAPTATPQAASAVASVASAASASTSPPVASAPSVPSAPSTSSASSAAAATDSATAAPLKDGTYTGWGTSRHGDIQATVQIKGGKIVFAAISECLTRYSCSWIAALPPQVVARQSPDVDFVSGATQSTNAF